MAVQRHESPGNKKVVATALCLTIIAFSLQVTRGLELRRWYDRGQFVEGSRLSAALLTFRPSDRAGQSRRVEYADLAPGALVRTVPRRCRSLTLLAVRMALDGESWTGINGSPAQPVKTLTVRYSDAAAARADLRQKRIAILTCRTVVLSFPPYDQPGQPYTVSHRAPALSVFGDRVAYALVGTKRYDFYVRRYANTLTWTYGDNASTPAVRRQVADDLVDRLKTIAQER